MARHISVMRNQFPTKTVVDGCLIDKAISVIDCIAVVIRVDKWRALAELLSFSSVVRPRFTALSGSSVVRSGVAIAQDDKRLSLSALHQPVKGALARWCLPS